MRSTLIDFMRLPRIWGLLKPDSNEVIPDRVESVEIRMENSAMQKKHIQPGHKVPLTLTSTGLKLIFNDLACLDLEYEQIIQDTPTGKPVMITLDELDEFGGHVAGLTNCQSSLSG